jgi:hypothetical protein
MILPPPKLIFLGSGNRGYVKPPFHISSPQKPGQILTRSWNAKDIKSLAFPTHKTYGSKMSFPILGLMIYVFLYSTTVSGLADTRNGTIPHALILANFQNYFSK